MSLYKEPKFQRLPGNAKPSHYRIKLSPDFKTAEQRRDGRRESFIRSNVLEIRSQKLRNIKKNMQTPKMFKFTFDGLVEISLIILSPTESLTLHSQSLTIVDLSLQLEDGRVFQTLPHTYCPIQSLVTINLPQMISPQKVLLHISFNGELNDQMRGFYRSSYKNAKGESVFMAATQFESTYARLAFPCWDEPIFKATFDVSLEVDADLTALSNMDIKRTTYNGTKKTVDFKTSRLMSTYLVAFAVGNLEYIQSHSKSGSIIRVYSVPLKIEQSHFALEVAVRAINWYDEWFGVKYPLPKCDLIAIPDFSMGGMENWGLVMFREMFLLIDSTQSSTVQKTSVARKIAHELAHLWFGDLVTMKWWTDLWLKEGFASFMEYLFLGYNYPEFKTWLHFLNDQLAQGLKLDSLRSSHPVENPNELDEIYDGITYAKSNSCNRMLCFYLGEETFQKGLQLYLKKFAYGNADTNDLWTCLSEISGQDIATLMSGWTKQMGYPLVSVEQIIDGSTRILKLKQKRFLADGGEDETQSVWQIPLTVCTSADPKITKATFLLTKREQEFMIYDVSPTDCLKLNAVTTGFYRVEYDNPTFASLLQSIENRSLSVMDRFGVTNDAFALVVSGRLPASQFLTLFESSVNEDEVIVWTALDSGISSLVNVLKHIEGNLAKRFNQFIAETLTPVAKKLGWEGGPDEDSQLSLLRSLILNRLAMAGDQTTIAHMNKIFEDFCTGNKEIHPNLRIPVFGSVVRNGGEISFNLLKHIYESTNYGEIEKQALMAMSQTPHLNLLEQLFTYGFIENKVKAQDVYTLLTGSTFTMEGQEFIWEFFKKNVHVILEKFGGAKASLFQQIFKMTVESSSSVSFASEIEAFFVSVLDPVSLKGLERLILQATESIRLNKRLLENSKTDVENYLTAKGF